MYKAWRKGQVVLRLLVILFVAIYGFLCREAVLEGNALPRRVIYLCLVGGIFLTCLLLTLLPEKEEGGRPKGAPSLFSLLFALSCPLYGYVCAELVTTQATQSTGGLVSLLGPSHLSPLYLSLNLFYISLLCLLFTALTGSLKTGPMLGAMGVSLFAIVNHYVYTFRGAAITASDVFSATTAANVLGRYRILPNDRIYLAYWLLLLLWSVAFRIRRHVHLLPAHPLSYLGHLLAGLAALALCVNLFITGSFLSDRHISVSFFNPMTKSYRVIGTALTFTSTIRQAIPSPPEGYSQKAAQEVASAYLKREEEKEDDQKREMGDNQEREMGEDQEREMGEEKGEKKESSTQEVTVSRERPNILIILDESFKDLQKLGDFELNAPGYLPLLRSLEVAFPTGQVYCQGYGGRTANTEFEFLTGMNVSFLPSDSIPFVTYIKSPLPSMAKQLRQMGYVGLWGVHPYRSNCYNRDRVYPLLGLSPCFLEDLPIRPKLLRELVSDESLFESLIYFYQQARKESRSPFFFYTMTMQNHSSYDALDFEELYYPVGLSREYEEVGQFMTLCQYTDQALTKLIQYFESTNEPTVLLFMGDHQPRLENDFYEEAEKGSTYENKYAKKYRHYVVDCYLWANFELPGAALDIGQSSMNYMQVNLFQILGLPLTPFQEFQCQLQKRIPSINRFAYLGADGKTYDFEDQSSPYYQDLMDYFFLCYNNLMDASHRVEDFFGPM